MKTVSYEDFLEFRPCWLETRDGTKKLGRIGKRKERWTALDVLDLPEEEVSAEEKLWAVLREEFIGPEILHEFACQCAEQALERVENPDSRSVAAIEAKRRWLRGEIGDDELRKAREDAKAAFLAGDCWSSRWVAAQSSIEAAELDTEEIAAWSVGWFAGWFVGDVTRNYLVSLLRELLRQWDGQK